MFDLTGRVAVVTGASRGIGRNIATHLATAGAHVALWGRDSVGLKSTQVEIERLGRRASISEFDISDGDKVHHAAAEAINEFGKVDVVVANAGINELRPFLDWTPAQWDAMISVNLGGALHTIQAFGRHMTERRSGSIITMSSIYSFVGAPGNSIYCLTKGGLMQLTKSLAVEWAKYNVRVNAICPGWIETDLTAPYMQDDKTVAAARKLIPMRRFGQPRDIGPMAVYLAADESQWTTGQSFVIDGGQIAR